MDPADLDVIASLACAQPEDAVIVEVGSWMGQSTTAWAANTAAVIYAVDLWGWMPKEYAGPGANVVDLDGDPFSQFVGFVGVFDNVVALRRNSSGGSWPYSHADIVFIDAMHQNPWVGEDIRYWEGLVKPGGIICGDDYSKRFPAVQKEAAACADRLGAELELPGTKFWLVRKPGGVGPR